VIYKKGVFWTLDRFVGIFLAVIAIVFVILAGSKIISYWTGVEQVRNSETFLKDLVGKIENLEEREERVFPLRGVEGYILAWDKEDANKPDICFFDNCLCVCPSPYIDSCQSSENCVLFDEEIKVLSKTERYISLMPGQGFLTYLNATTNCIDLPDGRLIDIYMSRNNGVFLYSEASSGSYDAESDCKIISHLGTESTTRGY